MKIKKNTLKTWRELMDKNYVIVYSDAYNVVKIHIGSITRIPSIVLIFFFSLCGRRLKGNGRGNSGVRDHGGRKGNSLVLSRARIPSSLSPA